MKTSSIIRNYTVLGFTAGLVFPIVATYRVTVDKGVAFSLENFLLAQSQEHLLYIIDTAPLVIGFLAFIAGKKHAQLKTKNAEMDEIIDEKTEHLRKKNRDLRREIEDRKYTEKQLIIAKEDAERAKRAEELFLANMSHELRTPLNGVVGFTRLLLGTKLNSIQSDYVSTIETSADHLLAIINDILEISKIKAGEIEFEESTISPTKLVMNAVNTFKVSAKQKNIALYEEIDRKIPPYLLGDQTRLNQILLNLIGNAVKFTESGSVVVKANLLKEEGQKVAIQFLVEDSGIGISQDRLEDIFEKFKQAEVSTTKRFGGTGLGLAICKEMVERQGGSIGVDSEVGKGSTFYFTLEFGIAPAQKIAEKSKGAIQEKDIGKIELLLVEDNKINVKLAENVFKKWGDKLKYSVAENGKVAIEMIKENAFDIILMDLQMPVMDGFEATEFIRKELKAPLCDIPIVAVSADVMASEKAKAYKAGISDYITKPFDANKLFYTITKFVG